MASTKRYPPHSPPPKDVEGSLRNAAKDYASGCVQRVASNKGEQISSEAAGLSMRDNEDGTATNEHGRDAGVRTSPRRTAR